MHPQTPVGAPLRSFLRAVPATAPRTGGNCSGSLGRSGGLRRNAKPLPAGFLFRGNLAFRQRPFPLPPCTPSGQAPGTPNPPLEVGFLLRKHLSGKGSLATLLASCRRRSVESARGSRGHWVLRFPLSGPRWTRSIAELCDSSRYGLGTGRALGKAANPHFCLPSVLFLEHAWRTTSKRIQLPTSVSCSVVRSF